MPSYEKISDLDVLVEKANNILAEIEIHIENGNERETDKLSQLYEQELENIFNFSGKTHTCFLTKLNFSKQVLRVDHPVESLVERAFESLSRDIEVIFSR